MAKAQNVTEDVQKQVEEAVKPVIAFNKLFADTVEKTFAIQMNGLEALSQIGLKNWKESLEIQSADDFKAYAEKQQNVAKEYAEIISSKTAEVTEVNKNFVEESRKMVQDEMSKAGVKAA